MERRTSVGLAVLATLLLGVVGFVGSAWLAPLPERLGTAGSTVVTYRDGAPAHVFLAPDDRWRIPVTLEDVDPGYIDALIRYEDKRFFAHPGVDPLALGRAVGVNLSYGRVMTGASTLTMQVVRMVEPRPRTVWSKVVEAHRALTLELNLSKEEILSAYLTFAPYGRNLEGVEAASLAYFSHSANALSSDEIATLLAVPQNPSVRYPHPKNAARLRESRDGIAAFLLATGDLDLGVAGSEALTLEEVKNAPVPTVIQRFPREAAHAAIRLRRRHAEGARIPTTLDVGAQRTVQDLVAAEREALARKGVFNGAVVVVDNETREIRAVVGNLDFWDGEHGGQIDGSTSRRSPGSALKPFLYGFAIDRGLALPEHLVRDVPRSWGTYTPENYDGRHRGLVRLDEALSQSLNLPFVELLETLGVESFVGEMRALGVKGLRREPGYYGLSAAAGGLEMTPIEMAAAYTALANGGVVQPVALEAGEAREHRVLSAGASWLTARTLQLRDRPDFPSRRMFSGVPSGIAWKTGTSFGHRDAWAAGFNERFTAVVWLGNLDYAPARDLVGAEAAGPILFDVLEGLGGRGGALESRPEGLAEIEVCAYSGLLPSEACPHRKTALASRTVVPTEECAFHQRLAVDLQTGEALTPGCRAGREWETRDFLVWPATVRRFLADQHRDLPSPPDYAEGCVPSGERHPPVILSPQAGQVSILIPGIAADDQEIPLAAEVDNPDAKLSWFVNGEFLATVDAEQRVWWAPVVGEHTAVVLDEAGMRAKRTFVVRRP